MNILWYPGDKIISWLGKKIQNLQVTFVSYPPYSIFKDGYIFLNIQLKIAEFYAEADHSWTGILYLLIVIDTLLVCQVIVIVVQNLIQVA